MKNVAEHRRMLGFATLALLAASACNRGHACGPGTVERGGQCVAASAVMAPSVDAGTAVAHPAPPANGHPPIDDATVDRTIAGRTVETGQIFEQWVFGPTEPRQLTIVDRHYEGDTAWAAVDVVVRGYAGRLRLHYEWIAGSWTLLRLENLSFRRGGRVDSTPR